MEIRSATVDDATDIAKVHADSWASAYRGVLDDAYLATDNYRERAAQWTTNFATPEAGQRVVVARDGDATIGFACLILDEDDVYGTLLHNIHVASEHHGRHAGAKLLREVALISTREAPDDGLFLWVVQTNINAQGFYQRYGGSESGEDVWNAPGGAQVSRFRYAWSTGQTRELSKVQLPV